MSRKILMAKISEIKEIMQKYGVSRAFAFGSAVKGEMHADSDIDFLISFPPELDYETYADNYFNLLHALRELLKRDVDLLAEETIRNPYLRQSIDQNKLKIL